MLQTLDRNRFSTHRFYRWLTQIAGKPIAVYLCLLSITLAGAFLRAYQLSEWSFWGDEIFTVSGSEDGFNYTPLRKSISSALIQLVTTMKGLNEWNARIVPAIIGVITIPIFYSIVKKIFDIRTALLAALLLALSPWHLYWSQNARFYTALLLFFSLALFFFYWGIEQDEPGYLLLSLLFLGLAAKERLLALFFVPIILIYLLSLHIFSFEKPKGWRYRNFAILALPGLIGGFLFAGPYLLNLPAWMSGFGFANNSPFWLAGGFAFYVGLPVICLGAAGGAYLLTQKSRAGLLMCISAVLPVFLLLVVSSFHYTANRYAFLSLTSWLVLAAVSAITFIEKSVWPVKLLALGALLVLLVQPLGEDVLYFMTQNGNRDNWKAAFAYVQQHRRPNDMVAVGNLQLADYYLSAQSIAFDQINFEQLKTEDQSIWFVEDLASQQKFPKLHNWLAQNAQLVSIHDVNFQARTFSMRVYLYSPGGGRGTGNAENGK